MSCDNSINFAALIKSLEQTRPDEIKRKPTQGSEKQPCSAQLGARILAVEKDLQQDCHVDKDLNGATNGELGRALIYHKVGGLEDVASRPQQHHLHAHAFGGVILKVLQQLREAQHGLKHDSQGAQSLHKHSRVQEQQGDDRTQHGEAEAEEKVVLERAPLPEVAKIQI